MPFVNREPLNKIKEGKDPITGKKLVLYKKTSNKWKANPNIPKVRAGDEDRVENYYDAKKDDFKGWCLHHRLELTLDNKDALSMIELINFGMYYHRPYFELVWLRENDHNRLHAFTRVGEKSNMFGITRDKHPAWKGDKVGPCGLYHRVLKLYRHGKISEDELQSSRDELQEYRRSHRKGIV